MTNRAELRRLAHEASEDEMGWLDSERLKRMMVDEWADFVAEATPNVVLSLLDECELLRNGAKGDFDLDAWLEWSKEAQALRSQNAGLIAQHGRDSVELSKQCHARDVARKERDKAEADRDAALAELEAIKSYGWRNHSVNYARAEKCPQTLETAQAAWDRDQDLIEEQRQQIAKCSQAINDLRQRLESLRIQVSTLTEWYSNALDLIGGVTAAIPGVTYMDPPDGGDVSIPEQIQRMAKDAERYRWLRDSSQYDWCVSYERLEFRIATPHHDASDLDACIDAAMSQEAPNA